MKGEGRREKGEKWEVPDNEQTKRTEIRSRLDVRISLMRVIGEPQKIVLFSKGKSRLATSRLLFFA